MMLTLPVSIDLSFAILPDSYAIRDIRHRNTYYYIAFYVYFCESQYNCDCMLA